MWNIEAVAQAISTAVGVGANDERGAATIAEHIDITALGHDGRALSTCDLGCDRVFRGGIGRREFGLAGLDGCDTRTAGLEWGGSDEAGEQGKRKKMVKLHDRF